MLLSLNLYLPPYLLLGDVKSLLERGGRRIDAFGVKTLIQQHTVCSLGRPALRALSHMTSPKLRKWRFIEA
jgi:hypothetical protein